MIALRKLLLDGHPAKSIVCADPDKTWAELNAAVESLSKTLPGPSEKPCLLAIDSAFQFAATLLASWKSRTPILIAPDTQPGTLRELAPRVDGLITDRAVSSPIPVLSFDQWAEPVRRKDNQPLEATDVALELLTSGSSGERKRVAKTFAQLENEIAALDGMWGELRGEHASFSTVSHLHIYGLLFNVLWPLSRGTPMREKSFFFWEELIARLPEGPVAIVSSPAHLRHLPQAARRWPRDWAQTILFSSGSALSAESAAEITATCGRAPIEVYGSTETGGIAWCRKVAGTRVPWTPLAGVSVRIEGDVVAVRSPWIPDGGAWHLSSDRGELAPEGGFHLLGRADRIAKVLEKRVSLTEMEQRLQEHPFVRQAKVLVAEQTGGRELLKAVIEIHDAARDALAKHGKAFVVRELKALLHNHFEAVTLPRRWRFVDRFPTDSQGKVTVGTLQELFARPALEKPTRPTVLRKERTEFGLRADLEIPAGLACLEGHFPNLPLVAGVCQLQWVVEMIEEIRGVVAPVVAVKAAKFHSILGPGQNFSIEVKQNGGETRWEYRLFRGDAKISSGKVVFAR